MYRMTVKEGKRNIFKRNNLLALLRIEDSKGEINKKDNGFFNSKPSSFRERKRKKILF